MDLTPSRQARGFPGRANDGFRVFGEYLAAALRAAVQAERAVFTVRVPTWSVAGAAAVLGSYALVLYFHADLTLVQGDAIGHIYIARRTIDSVTPSFAQLGYIWLPLPHVLMLPLIWNDTLWHTGLAGSLVSLTFFALSTAYIYRFVQTLSGSGLAGVIAAALFATNPNLLFMQTTPMGESAMIFFVIAASYHLVRWAQQGTTFQLIISAAYVFGGTLTRYEVWWLVPIGVGIVALASMRKHGVGRRVEGLTITWGLLASYGVVLWMIYNLVIFGDPLHFIHDIGSAQSFAREREASGVLPTNQDMIGSARLYGWAVIDVTGLPLVLAGVAGLVALVFSRLSVGVKLAVLFPASLFLFEIVSLSQAQSAMLSPHSQIPGFVNTRYGLLLLPAVVMIAGILARQLRLLGVLILFAALIPQLMVLPTPSGISSLREDELARAAQPGYIESWRDANFPLLQKDRPAALVEAVVASGESRLPLKAESDWLHDHARTGKILISEHFHASALMLYSRLPLSRFIYEGNRPYFQNELAAPGRGTEWIIHQPKVFGDEIHPLAWGAHPPGFELAFQDSELQIFHRTAAPDVGPPAGVAPTARLVSYETVLGEVGHKVDAIQTFYALRCRDGLAALITTRATIYAEQPCEQTPDDHALLTQPVGVILSPLGALTRITVDARDGGQLAFTAGHAWIEIHGDDPEVEAAQTAPRPASVPISARTVDGDIAVGDAHDTSAFAHTLYGIRCRDGVVSVITTKETLYAELACGELLDDHALLNLPVRVSVQRSGQTSVIHVESKSAGAVTFIAGRAWLLSH